MIKVGIIGADKPDSGELLRILVNHPGGGCGFTLCPRNDWQASHIVSCRFYRRKGYDFLR